MTASTNAKGAAIPYAPYYCEENAYKTAALLAEGRLAAGAFRNYEVLVVVATNEARACAHFMQKSAPVGQAALWDYHVFAAACGPRGCEVWDPSSRQECPVPAPRYLEATYPAGVPERYLPRFRAIPAELYLRRFSSDRRHMRSADGGWLQPPPRWPAIRGPDAEGAHELESLLDPLESRWGATIGLEELSSLMGRSYEFTTS